jgi:hypothetical protein
MVVHFGHYVKPTPSNVKASSSVYQASFHSEDPSFESHVD